MVTRGPVTRAVGTSITAVKPAKADTATVTLARQYAQLIDNAAPAAKYRRHLDGLRAAVAALEQARPELAAQLDAAEHLERIAEALAAHSVASDLGPKLLAALTALGMTPAARRAVRGGTDATPTGGTVTTLKSRRRTRATRAG